MRTQCWLGWHSQNSQPLDMKGIFTADRGAAMTANISDINFMIRCRLGDE